MIALVILVATILGGTALVAAMAGTFGLGTAEPTLTAFLTMITIDSVVFSATGLVILRQRPGNRLGRLLSLAGLLLVVTFSGFVYSATRTAMIGPDDTVAGWCAWIASLLIYPMFLVLAGIALLFPDGALPSAAWRQPVRVLVGVVAVGSVVIAFAPGPMNDGLGTNPVGLGLPILVTLAPLAVAASTVATLAAVALAAVAVLVRFRRARGEQREQLKWFLAAITVVAILLPLSFSDDPAGMTAFDALAVTSLSLLPISIGIAITRYRLYEIDRLISRTVSWAVISVVLAGTFAIGVIGIQALLGGLTQRNTLAVAASTLVAFALFQPLRQAVQRAVDRRFNRAPIDAERTVAAFMERTRDEVDLDRLAVETRHAAVRAVQPGTAHVWLRSGQR
ncbi:MAG TPA: hypothetical protein VF196_00475 [Casimicrobiaceae bacterium]